MTNCNSKASLADKALAEPKSSNAFDLPIDYANLTDPPSPRIYPSLSSGTQNLAFSEQTTKSHFIASSHDPPIHAPFTAQINIFLKLGKIKLVTFSGRFSNTNLLRV